MSGADAAISRGSVFRIAWPIILANAAVPLLGLVDTAVIGNVGTVADLGAIALGALIVSFLLWGFGFLRMGAAGFVAQAAGAGEEAEVRAALGRSLLLAIGIGTTLLVLQLPLVWLALRLFGASEAVESLSREYLHLRIWGAPASLALFALTGCLIGLGRSRTLLALQLLLNGLNILLDVVFAGLLGWGVRGIALGTAIAEWLTLAVALWLVVRLLRSRQADAEALWPWPRIRDAAKLARTLGANADIMLRTLLMLFAFGWFTNEGAAFGDRVLAANHVLLQLISFSAYFLDGHAFAAEALVGQALGARRVAQFDLAVRRSSELAAATAVVLAALLYAGGGLCVKVLTDLPSVRETAAAYLPHAALYVLVSVAAFQLDGIFIGATRTRAMRNASAASVAVFLLAWALLVPAFGNDGLWNAFIVYVVARAVTLGLAYPALRRSVVA